MIKEHLVVGAGVAGLACARELRRAGHDVVVIEKANGVGGRCATRRVEGQPLDFGPVFLHGSDPEFVRLMRGIPGVGLLEDWPRRRRGAGKPCQHEAFAPTERRFAFAEGVTSLPKFLAQGVDVRLRTRVTELHMGDSAFELKLQGDESVSTRSLVLAMPAEQTLQFIWPLVARSEELEAVAVLLDMVPSLPCLTLLAGYSLDTPAPTWDVLYPEQTPALMLVSHESSKRVEPAFRTLVIQAAPLWSREHLEEDPSVWSAALLAETANLVGAWVCEPKWTQPHRWRYSRVDLGNELTGPIRVRIGSLSLGLAGDVFAPGGGVEAAWNSGRTLARRLLQEEVDDG